VRGIIRRGLRLELVAALGITLAVPAFVLAAPLGNSPASETVEAQATETTLAAETHDHAGRTEALLTITVRAEDGQAASGAVSITDNGRPLAGASLDAQGRAVLTLALPAGDHALSASYVGDTTHRASLSRPAHIQAHATATPDFQISVAPTSLSITPGSSGTLVASITPENSAALTAPMFVTLSCSGLPDQATCTYTPENIEIQPNATAPITSSLVILTQQQEGSLAHRGKPSTFLAILLPGAFGLGGLAFAARRRIGLQRLTLLALLALVSTLGATACNARYNYYNHGPPVNPATPAGTYTIDVTAQSTNGVSATTRFTTLALTIK
jgi:hypothetical protein